MTKRTYPHLLSVLATCAYLISSATSVNVTAPALRKFRLHEHVDKGINRLGPGWVDSDEISCTRNCLHRYQDCMSVMYNRNTGLCTPGSKFNRSQPLPTDEEGDLYVTGCEVQKGFRLIEHNGIIACLKLVQEDLNYTDADAACQAMGSFMASVKTPSKLEVLEIFLQTVSTSWMIWVGCDDLDQNGLYVWKEDEETSTLATLPQIFDIGEPTATNGQYCMGIRKTSGRLNDMPCYFIYNFLCEQSVM